MALTLRGSMVAIVTPFRDDAIDEPAFKRLIELHVKSGTSAGVPCGTTGSSSWRCTTRAGAWPSSPAPVRTAPARPFV